MDMVPQLQRHNSANFRAGMYYGSVHISTTGEKFKSTTLSKQLFKTYAEIKNLIVVKRALLLKFLIEKKVQSS